MRTRRFRNSAGAFTLIELLIIIAVIALLATLLLPTRGDHRPATRIVCLNNLKQNSVGLTLWQTDHSNAFPWQVSTANGGTMELINGGQAFPHFRALAGCVPKKPTIFVCPTDRTRNAAGSVSAVENTNLSYFLSLDAGTSTPSRTILSGDRNVEFDGKPASPGLHDVSAARSATWTPEMHRTGGNVAFVDGHVEWCKTNQFNKKLREQGVAVSRWVVP